MLRLKHVPIQWKISKIIMVPEPNNRGRPISLMPVLLKVYKKLFIKRIMSIIDYLTYIRSSILL